MMKHVVFLLALVAASSAFRVGVFVFDRKFTDIRENGTVVGFEPAIAEAVCEEMDGGPCEYVPLRSSQDRLDSLEAGRVDMVIAAFSFAPSREAIIDFVKPCYFLDGGVVMLTREFYEANEEAITTTHGPSLYADLGAAVCSVDLSIYADALEAAGVTVVRVNDFDLALALMSVGECIGYTADFTAITRELEAGLIQDTGMDLLVPSPFCIGGQPGADEQNEAIGEVVKRLMGPGPEDGIPPMVRMEVEYLTDPTSNISLEETILFRFAELVSSNPTECTAVN